MREKILLLISLTFIFLPGISFAECPSLLTVSPDIKEYALNISSGFKSDFSIESKIKHIIKYIHGENGLNPKVFSPNGFFNLHAAFKGKNIKRIGKIKDLPKFKKPDISVIKAYAQIYNKYMVPNAREIVFAPTASDIIKHRMAFGCTHYARAFIAIAKALKLFKPEDIRYVVSSSHTDYNKACSSKGAVYDGPDTINGHQFVLLRYDNSWWFINTSNKIFEKVPAKNLDYRKQNLTVKFPSYAKNKGSGHNILLVRYIGKNFNDGTCDNSFDNLMNISVSGKIDNNVCLWPEYNR
ncbi:MAG: hypothetical protein KAI33_06210 [Elusimicrobiales bacterium]|nr:hypothetical protein [Elusimicrobiales bacterium]MCK5358228.1 hypothetical protein [Elusimicrobiales bacterium]MCK5583363.1 hypothetical protein [Elusimicrobiales bacterium]